MAEHLVNSKVEFFAKRNKICGSGNGKSNDLQLNSDFCLACSISRGFKTNKVCVYVVLAKIRLILAVDIPSK